MDNSLLQDKKYRYISSLAFYGSFFALGVIAIGAFTRLIDAGLGCPDWPGCYGHLTASAQNAGSSFVAYKAWAEMMHRYFAGCLCILILAVVTLTVIKPIERASNIFMALGLIFLVAYQIFLGRLTVTLKLLPIIVTQHLLGGFLILSLLWLLYLSNRVKNQFNLPQAVPKKFLYFAIIGLVLLFLQIMLGAWTSTNYASLSCPDFPLCINQQPAMLLHFKAAFNLFAPVGVNYQGGVLPVEIRQTIQIAHRLGALVLTLYLFAFAMLAIPKLQAVPGILKVLYLILGLLCIQVCLGVTNVMFKLPVVVAISHNVTAALLLLAMLTFTFHLARATRKG